MSERRPDTALLTNTQELEASRLRLLLALSPAVIYTCRPDGDYGATYITENIKEQLGYEPSDFIDDSGFWASKIHPEDRTKVFEGLSTLFQEGQHIHEYRFQQKDGTYRWMRDELRLLKDADGEPVEIIGSWMDITDRKEMEESLCGSQARLEEAQRIAHLGSWDWNLLTGNVFWSNEVYRIFGLDSQTFDLNYDAFLAQIHPEDRFMVDEAVRKTLTEGSSYDIDHRIVCPDGSVRHVHEQGQVIYGEDGEPVRMSGTVLDVTARKRVELTISEKNDHLNYLANYDSLTGLPNRYFFQNRLERAIGRAERSGDQLALLFLDLDLFKKVNDSLGHQVGDLLLQKVAKRLSGIFRSVDTVARFGGDEFVIILEQISSTENVARTAQKVLSALEQPFVIDEQFFYISASIGISLYSLNTDDVESLQKRADVAMHSAKDKGRNNYQFYSSEMDDRAHELLLLENDLRRALENDQLLLHYQPQLDLSSKQIIGLEALVRWRHPDKGMISPADFIPLAEDTGLIIPIGEWILRKACAQSRALQEAGVPPLRMCVNISMRQFKAPGFPELVALILRETGIDSKLLELEITESIAMENVSETISRLTILKDMGVRLAIDDFGTGYSSLSYLKCLPITTIKIDKAFVDDILTDEYDSALVKAIQAVAQSLSLEVVVEGVETKEQMQVLCKLECKLMQGFLFSRPLPADDVLTLCLADNPFEHQFDVLEPGRVQVVET